jgi:hypothetical protein
LDLKLNKTLGIVFSSLIVSKNRRRITDRLSIYKLAFHSILRFKPKNMDLIFIDNTDFMNYARKNSNKLTREIFSLVMSQKHIVTNKNTGTANKGLGELNMMLEAGKEIDLDNYQYVSYITGRQIHTTNRLLNLTNVESFRIAVSNPDFYFLDGRIEKPGDINSYNDMFFSMDSKIFKKYCDFFISIQSEMVNDNRFGSEQLLWKFVQENKEEVLILDHLGLLRNSDNRLSRIKSWHLI